MEVPGPGIQRLPTPPIRSQSRPTQIYSAISLKEVNREGDRDRVAPRPGGWAETGRSQAAVPAVDPAAECVLPCGRVVAPDRAPLRSRGRPEEQRVTLDGHRFSCFVRRSIWTHCLSSSRAPAFR